MQKKILFVDDEKQILRALKRLFINSNYDVHFANSGQEALKVLDEIEVDLVVTDIRMPEMDGLQLLRRVKDAHPLTLRVALSGYTDNKKVFNALEDNLAKLYLFKPWDNKELTAMVGRLFELEDILKDKNLLDIINNLDELPTVPDLYSDLCRMVEENADVDVISKKLEEDPAIASKLLRVANSAFYGAKTGSIAQAIMYIGLINVKNIVLTNAIFEGIGVDREIQDQLWKHVNLTNKLMNAIYQKCLYKRVPNMFASAGLLHDIGRVIIFKYYMDKYKAAMKLAENQPNSHLRDLEKELIGVDHCQIGGYLLNWWEIPVPIIESAVYHHNPLDENIINKELVGVVHIANYYSNKLLSQDFYHEVLQLQVFEQLGISDEAVQVVVEEIRVDEGL